MAGFDEILGLFESNGWVLQRIQGNYRVFREPREDFYWTVPVLNGRVSDEIAGQIKEYFKNQS